LDQPISQFDNDLMFHAPTPLRAFPDAPTSSNARSKPSLHLTDAVSRLSLAETTLPTSVSPSRPDDEVLEEFLGIMRPAITLVHRRRNSGGGGLSSSTSSSTSSTPVANSSVVSVKRPHPYRWNSLKRASSSLADSSHQSREERACARRKHRTLNSPKQLSPNYTVSVPPSPAFSDSSSAAIDLRTSPILRIHTRNPLPRHRSYETLSRTLREMMMPMTAGLAVHDDIHEPASGSSHDRTDSPASVAIRLSPGTTTTTVMSPFVWGGRGTDAADNNLEQQRPASTTLVIASPASSHTHSPISLEMR